MGMIYFDNAATTCPKPPEVGAAVADALATFGGSGRGSHQAASAADACMTAARQKLAELFDASNPDQVTFTSNATEALNTVIFGLAKPGDHLLTTVASHNSVLRPFYILQGRGCEATFVDADERGYISIDDYEQAFRPNTRLVVLTHASNVTGDVYDIERMAAIAHSHGAVVVLDVAQTAGIFPVRMRAMGIDVVCFTGHKGLYGPQGTGGIVIEGDIQVDPLKVGGSGIQSCTKEHPVEMPFRLEAGTQNAHGIAGLLAGIDFVERTGLDAIAAHERELALMFEEACVNLPRELGLERIIVMGGHFGVDRAGIVSFKIPGVDSHALARELDARYGICTRSGAHCAPLMHHVFHSGGMRFSFGYFNTREEVEQGIEALYTLSRELYVPGTF